MVSQTFYIFFTFYSLDASTIFANTATQTSPNHNLLEYFWNRWSEKKTLMKTAFMFLKLNIFFFHITSRKIAIFRN